MLGRMSNCPPGPACRHATRAGATGYQPLPRPGGAPRTRAGGCPDAAGQQACRAYTPQTFDGTESRIHTVTVSGCPLHERVTAELTYPWPAPVGGCRTCGSPSRCGTWAVANRALTSAVSNLRRRWRQMRPGTGVGACRMLASCDGQQADVCPCRCPCIVAAGVQKEFFLSTMQAALDPMLGCFEEVPETRCSWIAGAARHGMRGA